jgi:hypothetical protein
VFELQVNAYKIVIIFKHNKNEDTAHCYLTCNLNFFATAYLLLRKSFKGKVPADPFHKNLSDFFWEERSSVPNSPTHRYRLVQYSFEVHQKYNWVHFKRGWEGMYRNRGCDTISLGTKDGNIYLIPLKNGSTALSILNKICNFIYYNIYIIQMQSTM